MSYEVSTNGQTQNVTSYEAAKNAVKVAAVTHAANLAGTPRPGLYRSPKTAARIAADRLRSANKLLAGVKLPKTAGDVSGSVAGFKFAIARR